MVLSECVIDFDKEYFSVCKSIYICISIYYNITIFNKHIKYHHSNYHMLINES